MRYTGQEVSAGDKGSNSQPDSKARFRDEIWTPDLRGDKPRLVCVRRLSGRLLQEDENHRVSECLERARQLEYQALN